VTVYQPTILVELTQFVTLVIHHVFLVQVVLLHVPNVKVTLIKDMMLQIVNVGKDTTVINMETVKNATINV